MLGRVSLLSCLSQQESVRVYERHAIAVWPRRLHRRASTTLEGHAESGPDSSARSTIPAYIHALHLRRIQNLHTNKYNTPPFTAFALHIALHIKTTAYRALLCASLTNHSATFRSAFAPASSILPATLFPSADHFQLDLRLYPSTRYTNTTTSTPQYSKHPIAICLSPDTSSITRHPPAHANCSHDSTQTTTKRINPHPLNDHPVQYNSSSATAAELL